MEDLNTTAIETSTDIKWGNSAAVCWPEVPPQGQQGAALQFLTSSCKNKPQTAAAAAAVLLFSSRLAFSSSVTLSILLILSTKTASLECLFGLQTVSVPRGLMMRTHIINNLRCTDVLICLWNWQQASFLVLLEFCDPVKCEKWMNVQLKEMILFFLS